eukprot:Hpha_TRINITY_DN7643_c0_g1::TRINITY_DN7643_c0_g1_i1::g.19384::m.19384/K03773/fklB; FKBP-type peptidyl-prolyl cis-trans isomerase FklB
MGRLRIGSFVVVACLLPLAAGYRGQTGSGWDFQDDRKERRAMIEKGRKWLEKKSREMGVQKLGDSGLYYRVHEQGSRMTNRPSGRSKVEVRYEARDLEGALVAKTKGRGKKGKTSLEVNKVIDGLRAALPQMCEGDRWTVYIPYDQAYGTRADSADSEGRRSFSLRKGPAQPPGYSPLAVEVTLLKVVTGAEPCDESAEL